jgi:hypothetical protein
MFAEMIVLEHRRRVHLQRGEFDKAAEIAKLMHEKTEEFRRERANIVRELRQRLAVALEKGDFVETVRIANKINELEQV